MTREDFPHRTVWADVYRTDGVHIGFDAIEDHCTTWMAEHVPTRRVLEFLPSLPDAMERIRSGAALAELDRLDVERATPRCTWVGRWGNAGCLWPAEPGTPACRDPRHIEETS